MNTQTRTRDFGDGLGPVTVHDFRGDGENVRAHQHPNGGGWVANTAEVDPQAYVGAGCEVADHAKVRAGAKLYDRAYVGGYAEVSGPDTVIMGDATVDGWAVLRGGVRMLDHSRATGHCVLSGNTQLHDQARVTDQVHVTDVRVDGGACLQGSQRLRKNDQVIAFSSSAIGWTTTITKTHMAIGCQFYTHKQWLKLCTPAWAEEEHGVSRENYDRMWPALKHLMRVAAGTKKPKAKAKRAKK